MSGSFKFHQGSAAHGIGWEVEQSPTLIADWHNPAVISPTLSLQTDHMGQNGRNHSVEVVKTLDAASAPPVVCQKEREVGTANVMASRRVECFQQNQRDEVRLIGGDGEVAGAISSSGGSKNTNYVMCMSDTQSNAGVDGEVCGTLSSHSRKDPPVVCTGKGP